MESRLGGSEWDAEHCRCLRQRHPKEVVKDNERAPRGLEAPQGDLHDLAIRHCGVDVADDRPTEER